MLKLTTDKHEASRGLSATAELLVNYNSGSCTFRDIRGPKFTLGSFALPVGPLAEKF